MSGKEVSKPYRVRNNLQFFFNVIALYRYPEVALKVSDLPDVRYIRVGFKKVDECTVRICFDQYYTVRVHVLIKTLI